VSRKILMALIVFSSVLGWISVASADTIEVAVGTTSNTVSITNGTWSSGPYGSFSSIGGFAAAGSDAFPDILDSSSYAKSNGAGTLKIYITDLGITSAIGWQRFISSFSENSTGLTVTEQTYIDTSNTAFGTATLLNSATFTSIGNQVESKYADINGPYSATEIYTITATGSGSHANSSIDLTIPEPASMALLGSGLLFLGAIDWRRRRRRL
jgi:hypothetical protein